MLGAHVRPDRTSRALTVFAAGFLLLDGVLLLLAGVWSNRMGLVAWGIVFVAGAIGVGVYWRFHSRRLAELREALLAEAAELHRLRRDIERERQ